MSRHIHIHVHSTRDSQIKTTGVAKYAGILYCAKGRYLLVRRSKASKAYGGYWAFPGGHMEQGETPEQAAIRECFEEIGTGPTGKLQSLGVVDGFETFLCHIESPFQPTLNHEHSDYVWAGLDLPKPMHPSALKVLYHLPPV